MKITFSVLAGLLLAGCNVPQPDRNYKGNVTEKDVIGTWTLSPQSLAYLVHDGFKDENNRKYQITFNSDGTCVFQTILDDFNGGTYYDITGTWRLEKNTCSDSSTLKKNAIYIEWILQDRQFEKYLNFAEADGKLTLWSFYGDPDSCELMEYAKEPAK